MNQPSFSIKDIARNIIIGIAGSFIIIAFLFYASVSPGQGIHPNTIISAIRESAWSYFLVFVAFSFIGIWLRAIRYQILIRAAIEGDDNHNDETDSMVPGIKQMMLITAVRGMLVDLLPARLGEVFYVALLKKYAKTSIPAGLSSLLFAILLDIAVLAPITILIVLMIGFPTATPLKVALVAIFIVVSFYIGIRFILPSIVSAINRFKPDETQQKPGFRGKIIEMINQLNLAVQTTIRAGVLLRVLSITVVIRSLKYLGLLILFYSVAKGSFPDLATLSWLNTLGAMIASEMTAALPIPTIMSFGAWEAGGMTFMSYFGAPPQDSLIALIAVHIKTQAVDYGIGLAALLLLFLSGSKIKKSMSISSSTSSPRSNSTGLVWPVAFGVVAVAAAIGSWKWFEKQERDFIFAPETPTIPLSQRPDWLQNLDGYIVWSSNKYGNHDIMIMDLSDLSSKQLTNHENTETHPRISPDGTKVVFIRSLSKWQSWRDQRPWNVWVHDIETSEETQIAESGTSPTWSEDGNTVYFHRSAGEIWAHDITTGKQERLYQRNEDGVPDAELLWPSIDSTGRLAVSYKDNGRPTTIIAEKNKDVKVVALGCMITWSPKNDFAIFVSNIEGGKQQNQFNKYDPQSGEIVKLLDLPGELSHEYFPRLDQSQQYLVFAASDGAHEPDIEDYEIHIWKTDTDNSEAQRLTFDSGNDSWPDIYIRGN